MRIRSTQVAILVVLAIFGTVAGTSLAGIWKTEGSRVPRRIEQGEFAGSSDPADIRGSYAFSDVERAFGISSVVLAEAFSVTAPDSGSIAAKDLEAVYGEIDGMEVGTDSLRLFVSLYNGMPYTPEETTALPQSAYAILTSGGTNSQASAELVSSLADRVVTVDVAAWRVPVVADDLDADDEAESVDQDSGVEGAQPSASGPAGDAEHSEESEEGVVKGQTTFADLLSWGLTREQIETVIDGPMPARATKVRDHATEQSIGFGEYRNALQLLLDAIK